MKDVTLKPEQLKKIDYPYDLPADLEHAVTITPEMLLFSVATSLKRIANALDDGLIHLDPNGGGVFGLADITASIKDTRHD